MRSHATIGIKRSEETRRKISEIQRGKKLTEEHKSKIRTGVKHRFDLDDSLGDKISQKLTDKKKSDQHRKNISETRKSLLSSGEIVINRDKISAAVTQRYLDGGFEWSRGQYTSSKTGAACNYRSSWEREFMELLDSDPRVETWRYEPLSIPYIHEGKTRRYIPDFLIVLSGEDVMVEVKPQPLTDIGLNETKRRAAEDFCQRNGWRYLTWKSGESL